jgi:hypothetical protein
MKGWDRKYGLQKLKGSTLSIRTNLESLKAYTQRGSIVQDSILQSFCGCVLKQEVNVALAAVFDEA